MDDAQQAFGAVYLEGSLGVTARLGMDDDGHRGIKDGFCGVYADWKIDYGPTDHLLTMV